MSVLKNLSYKVQLIITKTQPTHICYTLDFKSLNPLRRLIAIINSYPKKDVMLSSVEAWWADGAQGDSPFFGYYSFIMPFHRLLPSKGESLNCKLQNPLLWRGQGGALTQQA
jgi:hypothetical protein